MEAINITTDTSRDNRYLCHGRWLLPKSLTDMHPGICNRHLSGVLVTVTDQKQAVDDNGNVGDWTPTVASYSDYYPFGMQMPGRNGSSGEYRYGFNGMEKDDEVKGSGNSLDFGARIYDSRLGRWLSVDPEYLSFTSLAPYSAFLNNPLIMVDPDGRKVRAMSDDAFRILLSSLSPEDRKYIRKNKKGFIKISSVKAALKHSNSENLKSLYLSVKDKRTIELYTTKQQFDYLDEQGKRDTEEFKPAEVVNMYQELMDDFKGTPEEKEQYGEILKERGYKDEMEVTGLYGITLIPLEEQIEYKEGRTPARSSTNSNTQVYINPMMPNETKAEMIGHELFGHALFNLLGKDSRHGGGFWKVRWKSRIGRTDSGKGARI